LFLLLNSYSRKKIPKITIFPVFPNSIPAKKEKKKTNNRLPFLLLCPKDICTVMFCTFISIYTRLVIPEKLRNDDKNIIFYFHLSSYSILSKMLNFSVHFLSGFGRKNLGLGPDPDK
jgi:hypothetical protein